MNSVLAQFRSMVRGGSEEINTKSHEAISNLRSKIAEAKEVIGVYDTQASMLSPSTPTPLEDNLRPELRDRDWVSLCRSQVIKIREKCPGAPVTAAGRHVSYIVRPFRGLVIPPHVHPETERIHIIAGSLRNLLTDETVSHNTNMVVFTPNGVLHGYVVLEDSVLVVTYSNN